MNFAGATSLLPLLNKRLSDLTLENLQAMRQMFDIKVDITDELKSAAIALFQGKDIDTVSDLIQSPESVAQLVSFLQGGIASVREDAKHQVVDGGKPSVEKRRQAVVDCPHCNYTFLKAIP